MLSTYSEPVAGLLGKICCLSIYAETVAGLQSAQDNDIYRIYYLVPGMRLATIIERQGRERRLKDSQGVEHRTLARCVLSGRTPSVLLLVLSLIHI